MKKLFYSTVRLIESKDKDGKDWNVCIIQAGMSLNDKRYKSGVLKKALPLFENLKSFAYEFKGKLYNHLPNVVRDVIPEGCVKNLTGWFDKIRWGNFKDAEGKTQEGVLGHWHISENAKWLRQFLKDAWEHGKKSLLGFSIDGGGEQEKVTEGGRTFYDVLSISNLDEATVVTHPAAGGQPIRLLASKNFYEEEAEMNWLKELYELVKRIKEAAIEGIDSEHITEEQELVLIEAVVNAENYPEKDKLAEQNPFLMNTLSRLSELIKGDKKDQAMKLLTAFTDKLKKQESSRQESEEEKKAREAKEAEDKKKTAEERKTEEVRKAKEAADEKKRQESLSELEKVKEEMKKMKEDTERKNCAAILNETLSACDLFKPVQEKVRKQFTDKIFKKEDLDETIKLERETLSQLSESGNVSGLGKTKVEVTASEEDKRQIALDLMIDDEAEIPEKLKESMDISCGFTSIKEAYRAFHPEDTNITGNIDRTKHAQRLMEAVTTGDFSYALGTSMTRRVVREYKKVPFIFDPIVTQGPISDFKQQERVMIGGYSTLPAVTEDADYGDLYEPRDQEATYTAGTKGGIISFSRIAIKNDDLGIFRRFPKKLTTAAVRTLQRDVINLLLANGTYTVTNTTVFSTTFENYTTNALGYDELGARMQAMKEKKEWGSARLQGTATATSSTTLDDTSESAVILDNVFDGYYLRIVYGTGAGQIRLISNTATSNSRFTITPAWTATPSTDSVYEVSAASNDDEVIGAEAKYIIHGSKLDPMVDAITISKGRPDVAEREDNRFIGRRKIIPIYCPYITGSTYQYYWYLCADKTQGDIIEIGFVDNQRVPMLVIQDQPALGQVFTKKRIRYRVDWEYGLAIIDNKLIDANEATQV